MDMSGDSHPFHQDSGESPSHVQPRSGPGDTELSWMLRMLSMRPPDGVFNAIVILRGLCLMAVGAKNPKLLALSIHMEPPNSGYVVTVLTPRLAEAQLYSGLCTHRSIKPDSGQRPFPVLLGPGFQFHFQL